MKKDFFETNRKQPFHLLYPARTSYGFIENQEYGLAFFFSSDKQVITQDENTNNGFSPICALLTLFMQDKDNSSMKENKNGHENDYMDPSFR